MSLPSPRLSGTLLTLGVSAATALTMVCGATPALAAPGPVPLGTSAGFAVLAATTVTNTGPTQISAALGLSPGSSVTGFPPGIVSGGMHVTDSAAAQAQLDATAAYNDAASRIPTENITADLAGRVLLPGVYSAGAFLLGGTLTLDAAGDPNAVFIFQAASTITTASSSLVALARGASACNVFWKIGSSATLGTYSVFRGTIVALTSITATTGVAVTGRLIARNAAVTLDSNTISPCAAPTAAVVPADPPPAAVPGPAQPTSPSAPGAITPPATPGNPADPANPANPASPLSPLSPPSPPSPLLPLIPPMPFNPLDPLSPATPSGSRTPTTAGVPIIAAKVPVRPPANPTGVVPPKTPPTAMDGPPARPPWLAVTGARPETARTALVLLLLAGLVRLVARRNLSSDDTA